MLMHREISQQNHTVPLSLQAALNGHDFPNQMAIPQPPFTHQSHYSLPHGFGDPDLPGGEADVLVIINDESGGHSAMSLLQAQTAN